MKKFILALALVAGANAQAQAQAQTAGPAVYNEAADARAELNLALASAQKQHKNVLVIFGANWCKDCLSLDGKLKGGGALSSAVDKRYVIVKVDVGRFNRNTDLAEQMGVPLKKGIPAVAVLKDDGTVRGATGAGELADARGMGEEAVLRVLDRL